MEPTSFTRIELAAGPRTLPAWARDLSINFRHGWGNRPDYKIRCREDPTAFTRDGSPVWTPFSEPGHSRGWRAEREGVAAVHYHGGAISVADFEEHVRWIDPPSQANGWKGEAETRKYQMLATAPQDGYAGRAFDITLDACSLPVWSAAERRAIETAIERGTVIRLRGPWHGGAPEGYMEVHYDTDASIAQYGRPIGKRRPRPWYNLGGYFGLYVTPALFLDIAATYQPHIEWAWVDIPIGKETRRYLEPLVPETGLPKGVYVAPSDCPGHQYVRGGPATQDHPSDRCKFCGEKRDPSWVYVSPWDKARIEREAAERAAAERETRLREAMRWPADVLVPRRPIPNRNVPA